MARIENFEELEVWREARELSRRVRELSQNALFAKDFRFSSQINSAAGSVMDNIAEGFERDGNREFINFLFMAKGSNGEVRSQSYRAFDSQFISQEELEELLSRTELLKR
ncbi:four helix bundle protein [Algoriphagus sp. oki45]|uniref:four helix bundle protein n=1 Tax=Algoriphagus sp. oki45 TaxID=3067294 RepID=UPI0027FD5088|nr:four helix bundle protein [Algoriphagus sp. oki45]